MIDFAFPELKAENDLILRELRDDDIDAISSIWGTPQVGEELSSGALSRDDSVQMLYVLRSLWKNDAGIRWGVEHEGRLIGTCGFHNINRGAKRGELGYELDYAYWGKGLMRRALCPVLDYGFNIMRFMRIEVLLNIGNERSANLARKLGFVKEGTLREYAPSPRGLLDQDIYSLIKREWQSREK